MSKRAERRHHRKRRIAAEYKKWSRTVCYDQDIHETATRASLYNHSRRTPCSCCMCGNPRRNGWESSETKKTFQERKAPRIEDQ